MVVPMIDIMFFLLGFFMIATVNMSDSGKMPIKLASMQQLQITKIQGLEIAVVPGKTNFSVNHEAIPSVKTLFYCAKSCYCKSRTPSNLEN